MPLTNLTNNLTTRAVPLDVVQQFSLAQTLTASGFVNNVNTQVDLRVGRESAGLVLDLSALKVSAGNETYLFGLFGSNDPAFGAGNVELITAHDFAAAAGGRLFSAFCGASPAVPQSGESIRRHFLPFSNAFGGFMFRYMQLYALLGGTAPSVTLTSWITDRESLG